MASPNEAHNVRLLISTLQSHGFTPDEIQHGSTHPVTADDDFYSEIFAVDECDFQMKSPQGTTCSFRFVFGNSAEEVLADYLVPDIYFELIDNIIDEFTRDPPPPESFDEAENVSE